MPSTLGGLQTGCAFDGEKAYTNGIDYLGIVKASLDLKFIFYPPAGGRMTAIRPQAAAEVSARTARTINPAVGSAG